jgi:hypothetical protein
VSAAAHRPPAPWHRVALAESAALWQPRSSLLTLGLVVLVTLGPLHGGVWDGPLSEVRDLALLMFFFPLLHWRGRAMRGSLEQAMPVDGVRYDLLRMACGAAGAVFTLGLATGLNLVNMGWWYTQNGGYPGSYPVALIAAGTAFYLLGAAIVLRAERPGRVLLAAWLPAVLAFQLSGGGSWGSTVTYAPDGRVTSHAAYASLTLGTALLWLAAGIVAVAASAILRSRGGGRWMRMPSFASGRVPRAEPRPAEALERIRRPAPARVVVMRQLAVQAPRMAVPLLMAVLLAAWAGWRETGGSGTFLSGRAPLLPFVYAAFFWPVLVWMDERRGDWDEQFPVDPFTRRLLHAAAGLVWLQAAVLIVIAGCIGGALAEGTLQSLAQVPAWALPGVPLAVVALYCVGTAWTMMSEHPVRTAVIGFLVTVQVLVAIDLIGKLKEGRSLLSPSRAFAPVNFMAPVEDHRTGATILWILIFAALAVFAMRRRIRRDLHRTAPMKERTALA